MDMYEKQYYIIRTHTKCLYLYMKFQLSKTLKFEIKSNSKKNKLYTETRVRCVRRPEAHFFTTFGKAAKMNSNRAAACFNSALN